MNVFRSHPLRRTLLLWLGVTILLAQGLRVCLHGHDDLSRAADASPVHLESTLSTLSSHDETDADGEIPLAALLKLLSSIPFAALAWAAVFLLIAREPPHFALSRDIRRIPDRPPHLSPPGRAPPR